MPSASLYAPPQIPGISMPPSYAAKLPDVLRALAETEPKSDERAQKLTGIAKKWGEAHKWYRREATKCEAYDHDAQYGFIDDATGLWTGNTLDKDADRVRITMPITRAINDTAVSLLTQDEPIFLAVPGRSGVASRAAAKVGRAFCDQTWGFHKLTEMYRGTARGAFCPGTDFVLLEWDKAAGQHGPLLRRDGTPVLEEVPDEEVGEAPDVEAAEPPAMPAGVGEDGSLVPPPMGLPAGPGDVDGGAGGPGLALAGGIPAAPPLGPPARPLRPKVGPQGELSFRRLTIDQVHFDPTARKPGGTDGLGIVVEWNESRATVYEMLKADGREAEFFDLPDGDDTPDDNRMQRTQRASAVDGGGQVNTDGTIKLRAMYLRARIGRPRGDCFMWAGGKMIYEGENDIYPTKDEMALGELWPCENWPLFTFLGDERRDNPWGRGRTISGIPIQDAINGCYSKDLQHQALIANVKYVLPAGFDWEPNDEPGQVARPTLKMYQQTGGKPVQMTQPPQMPEYRAEAEGLIQKYEYVTGVNAASMGNAPSAQPSGVLTQKLQERDNGRIAPMKRALDNQWGRVMTYALRLIRRHATGERMLRVVGKDMSVSLMLFKVAELAAGTEILVLNDNALSRDPTRRSLQLESIFRTVQTCKTPDEVNAYLELARLPDTTDWLQRRSPHETAAQAMCETLLAGEDWLPGPWDNAMIFKSEIESFGLSMEYRQTVAEEKADPATMGQSPLEQRVVQAWTYYTQKAMPPVAAPQIGAPEPAAQPVAQAA